MPRMRRSLIVMTLFSLASSASLALSTCDGIDPSVDSVDAGTAPDSGNVTDASSCVEVARSEPIEAMGELGALGGTLEVPSGCGPFRLLVILSGSGSSDRDGNDPALGGPDNYRALALRDVGIASIRYDDHGIGDSKDAVPARAEDLRFDLEIADAARWVEVARATGSFDRILFAGHSQGSLTAILADKARSVDGIVSLAGTSLRAGRLLIEQLRDRATEEELAALEHAVGELEAERTVEGLPPRVASIMPLELQQQR